MVRMGSVPSRVPTGKPPFVDCHAEYPRSPLSQACLSHGTIMPIQAPPYVKAGSVDGFLAYHTTIITHPPSERPFYLVSLAGTGIAETARRILARPKELSRFNKARKTADNRSICTLGFVSTSELLGKLALCTPPRSCSVMYRTLFGPPLPSYPPHVA